MADDQHGDRTVVLALLIGENPIVPSVYPMFRSSFKRIFSIMTALCAAGVFFSLARGNLRGLES